MTNKEIDNCLEDIKRTIELFCKSKDIVEIRILKTKEGIVSGYYNINPKGLEKLLLDIKKYIPNSSIYFTLNPPKDEFWERSKNRLTTFAKSTTKDDEIKEISWLHIDLDPVRSADTSSTSLELELAQKKAERMEKSLRKQFGLENPVVSCSGNGFNLDYKLEPTSNTKENKEIMKQVLKFFDVYYSDEKIKVDTTTYNPSRIIKVFGCKTFKGEDTETRPHRYSEIIKIPDEITTNSFSILKKIADIINYKKGIKKSKINIEEKLKKENIKIYKKKEQKDSNLYVLENCPWNSEHTNKSAFIIEFNDGNIYAACHHDSCQNKGIKDLPFLNKENTFLLDDDSVIKKYVGLLDTFIKELFVNQDSEGFVYINYDNAFSIHKISSLDFEKLIHHIIYAELGEISTPSSKALISTHYDAKAKYSKNFYQIQKRVHKINNIIYYDLCNDKKEIVKIENDKVEIIKDVPILFYKSSNMLAQLKPVIDNKISLLELIKKHFRIKTKSERLLFSVYLVSCFVFGISHPIITFFGEKGAAKSTSMKMMRLLVDPVKNLVTSLPTKRDDLISTISNSYMTVLDNVQKLTSEASEIFCICVTGGSVSKRKLYTDNDEKIIEMQRIIALNGIEVVMSQPDLLDRSILIELNRIPKNERKTENEVMEEFTKDIPLFLGSIFKTLSKTLSIFGTKEIKSRSRMADFVEFGFYICESMGKDGELFLESYKENQDNVNDYTIVSNALADVIVSFMIDKEEWSGKATELLKRLNSVAYTEKIDMRSNNFPKSASILSRKLKQIQSNLEDVGITFEFEKQSGNKNKIIISKN